MAAAHRPRRTPVGVRLAATAKRLERAFDEALAAAGGSRPRWLVLMALRADPRASQRRLADAIGIDGATLTHHLNGMEADGLLTRSRDPADRRNHVIELTPAGEAAFAAQLTVVQAFDRRLRSGLGADDLDRLEAILDRLDRNVSG